MAQLALHQHGKSKVRLGRVWREGNVHHFVEWQVHTMLESDMEVISRRQRSYVQSVASPRPCSAAILMH